MKTDKKAGFDVHSFAICHYERDLVELANYRKDYMCEPLNFYIINNIIHYYMIRISPCRHPMSCRKSGVVRGD